jgi:hypothetical protein
MDGEFVLILFLGIVGSAHIETIPMVTQEACERAAAALLAQPLAVGGTTGEQLPPIIWDARCFPRS